MTEEIFFSYIIPTIGRESLEHAVRSVLDQTFTQAGFEVIVVNDSGIALPPAAWQASPQVTLITTNKCERSFARNSGAAVAKGKYLAFLDDDDWILPGALQHFYQLALKNPQAAWLYGGVQIVDEHHAVIAEINSGLNGNVFSQIMGGAWAPIQSSLVLASAFFEAGGYSPFICGTEDEDLCRRIASSGDFANTPAAVACLYRGQTWNTSTNYLRAPADTKYSRDLILAAPGFRERALAATRDPYWRGRLLRICLSTVGYNLRRKRLFSALSRLVISTAVFAQSFTELVSARYWAGLRADHPPQTLHFVMREYDQQLRARKSIT